MPAVRTHWTKETIKAKIESSTKMVERSLVKLYERQTRDEQASGTTVEHNGIGFTGVDAPILTSFARQVVANKWGRVEGQILTPKQRAIARRVLLKYWKQLLAESEARDRVTDSLTTGS